ncbi:MAG: hypothetical protein F4Y92_06065 [Dehalococcoidia bacterium]|nr:hypothetical protein [Dehalococcoidia bacterium]
MPSFRVSPPRVHPEAERSSRPPAGSAGSVDAHRQTAFVLGETVELVLDGLRLESAVAGEAAGSRYRNVTVAALLATGSRAWLARLEALHAIETGAYAAAVPLVASAADHEAACAAILAGADTWQDWLDADGVGDLPEAHATRLALGAPPDDVEVPELLADVRAAANALAQPSPGPSALLSGGESGPGRLAVTFGDRDFHMALAELTSGWLLALGVAKVELLLDAGDVLPVADTDALGRWAGAARRQLDEPRRCRIERREIAGDERFVVENWRRAPSGAVRRIVL